MPGITSSASYQPADVSRPVLETTVGGVLREAAEQAAGTIALVEGTPGPGGRRRWSYADLLAASEGAARALLGRFAPGERVAVWAPNSPEWLLMEFGAALAGLTLVTVNPALRAGEAAHVLGQSRAHGVVLAQVRGRLPGLREVISLADWDSFVRSGSPAERLPDVGPDDEAQIQYTSGTTGLPKGAILRHRGITNSARFCAEILQAGPGDVWVNPMPLFHTAGCALFTLGPVQGRFTQVVPTMLLAQLDHPDFPGRDLSQVRSAFAGGATVPPALVRRIESAAGVPLSIQYGQTEASCITQTRPGDPPADRAETLGRPHPQVEVQITHPATGETLPAGSVGEILTRGYHVMKGYFASPAATSEAIDTEGWLHTGDLGCMDERGYCRIEGRLKEMIIRGGENIYPREIEQLLHTHPGVADVAVVGVPDDYWGEQVAAFVRPAPGSPVTQDDLASYCRARLAAHKTPRHWVFADAFPLTASGKVQKFILREQLTSGAAAHQPHRDPTGPQPTPPGTR